MDERLLQGGWPMNTSVTNNSGQIISTAPYGDSCSKKRRRTDDITDLLNDANQNKCPPVQSLGGRSYLPLPKCDRIFHTEEWKPRATTLFLPLMEDILVNLKNFEQISFSQGTFFVADDKGNYSRSEEGQTVNLWRYSEQQQRLYISRSFLFTNPRDFLQIQEYLKSI